MTEPVDVLMFDARPTALALDVELAGYGTRFRIIDRAADRVHESRALAIQPAPWNCSPATAWPRR